jgi:hypothetical protein
LYKNISGDIFNGNEILSTISINIHETIFCKFNSLFILADLFFTHAANKPTLKKNKIEMLIQETTELKSI